VSPETSDLDDDFTSQSISDVEDKKGKIIKIEKQQAFYL
jgi:hypothetical protein